MAFANTKKRALQNFARVLSSVYFTQGYFSQRLHQQNSVSFSPLFFNTETIFTLLFSLVLDDAVDKIVKHEKWEFFIILIVYTNSVTARQTDI